MVDNDDDGELTAQEICKFVRPATLNARRLRRWTAAPSRVDDALFKLLLPTQESAGGSLRRAKVAALQHLGSDAAAAGALAAVRQAIPPRFCPATAAELQQHVQTNLLQHYCIDLVTFVALCHATNTAVLFETGAGDPLLRVRPRQQPGGVEIVLDDVELPTQVRQQLRLINRCN
jgi:hypothetical protein